MEETLKILITVDKDNKIVVWHDGKKVDLSRVTAVTFKYVESSDPKATLELVMA